MARYIGPVCRICRRENMKLFLKGTRCATDKCAVTRRSYPPGQHGQGHSKASDYGLQLREKQKTRRMYGILEAQFRGYYAWASSKKGKTGENLLQLLEMRLDNVAYRAGFARSRNEARQLVRHAHFTVNGRKVNIPSFQVRPGDVLAVRERSKKVDAILTGDQSGDGARVVPTWLEVDRTALVVKVTGEATRETVTVEVREQLIVELYSK